MTDFHKQDCILCDEPAEYCLAGYDERKYFSCPNCSRYQISAAAETKLTSGPQRLRDEYAEKAKSLDDDTVLVIFVPNVKKTEGLAYESLRGEPTKSSEVPQCR